MGVSLDDGRQIGKILSFSRLLILSAFVSTSHWVQLFADNSALWEIFFVMFYDAVQNWLMLEKNTLM